MGKMKTRFRIGPFTFGSSGIRFSPWRRGSGVSVPILGAKGNSFGKIKLGPFSFYFGGKKRAKKQIEQRSSPSGKPLPKAAYKPWSEADDRVLLALFRQGSTVTELSERFQRTQGAIKSRINKLMMEE